jgi:hypothetical protein
MYIELEPSGQNVWFASSSRALMDEEQIISDVNNDFCTGKLSAREHTF